ncbi:4-hydroxy-tetrahydrodipicolinate reductase [Candidatus Bealeia paramacronuclearis]|uniref:4-hydroxy-tetrahydrodipicolinate reductase n=1 Tax=Candidatus Bealeia paramacronuclearis TaxID=1921001 RepID=A0ABZ2C115_9PROT|nr:4-hydroxy-tetrahydrodipicolinate reductase [Candidatus Bealeia paramacronuclearis]
MLKVSVTGSTGRMGRMIMHEVLKRPNRFHLTSAVVRRGSHLIGDDISTLLELSKLDIAFEDHPEKAFKDTDVVIDFSQHQASLQYIAAAQQTQKPILVGTTGFSSEEKNLIINASAKIPILLAPNTSLGIAIMNKLVFETAKALGPDYDVEIVDIHHNLKKDAPSGTALSLAESVEKSGTHFVSRDHTKSCEREKGAVGFAIVRAGSIVGQHDVIFAGSKESLTISHQAFDRTLFADGALKAAEWLKGKKAGLYTMKDVIGLS